MTARRTRKYGTNHMSTHLQDGWTRFLDRGKEELFEILIEQRETHGCERGDVAHHGLGFGMDEEAQRRSAPLDATNTRIASEARLIDGPAEDGFDQFFTRAQFVELTVEHDAPAFEHDDTVGGAFDVTDLMR